MDGAEKGRHIEQGLVEYLKVEAYRLIPLGDKKGYVSIDGEHTPREAFQVESHKGLARVLSLDGENVWRET
jgi:sphingosine kinase